MTRLLGYVRVSTDDQAHTGYGLSAQTRQIEQACEQRGWRLEGICRDEGLSAKSLERPALLDALGKVARKRGPDGLIVAKLDRLTRSVIDFATLLEWFNAAGATLVALDFDLDTSTPGGRLIAHIMSAVAEWERETIGQRTRDGLAAARAQGRGVNGPSVAGTPELAQRILALRAQGCSLQGIVVALSAYGLVGLVLARLVAGIVAYDVKLRSRVSPEAVDWALGCMVGLFAGALWPVLAVGKLLVLIPICGQAETRARQRQHEQELREREEKVAQLERDLGIGGR